MHILTIDKLIFHFFVKRITVLSSLSIIKPDLPGLKHNFTDQVILITKRILNSCIYRAFLSQSYLSLPQRFPKVNR